MFHKVQVYVCQGQTDSTPAGGLHSCQNIAVSNTRDHARLYRTHVLAWVLRILLQSREPSIVMDF